MFGMRWGFRSFTGGGAGLAWVSAGGVAALVAVCGPTAGVAHGGTAHGSVGDPVAPAVVAARDAGVRAGLPGGGAGIGAGAAGRGPAPVSVPGLAAAPVPVSGLAAASVPVRGPASAAAGEADLAFHGHVSLWAGRVGVWVEPSNHGPGAVPDATVRLRFSVPLAGAEPLPPGCLRGSPDTVLCSTGAMRAAGAGRPFALDLRVAGSPAEVVVNIGTAWSGGAGDRNPDNNTHRVLAPATGDKYAY
ncbi:hypothetical protein ACFWXK_23370 [Streptomyces sp. NPDC059070]|uniref:hypothetical protein n=1 Tax=Streptomyces sp. NPDC059070 TaxID=3346713 RepID=UPI00369E85CD